MDTGYLTTIRPYSPNDYRGVVEVLKETGLFDEDMDAEMRFANKIVASPGSILVVRDGNLIVGCVVIVEEWGPLLFRLAIRHQYREKGIGSTLLEQAEEYLRKKYHKEVHLLVDERDRDLIQYYEKRGYRKGNLYRWMEKRL